MTTTSDSAFAAGSAIACLDVAYSDEAAAVACVLINSWDAASPTQILSRRVTHKPAAYAAGAFYKRELALLQLILDDLSCHPNVIVVDAYVWLGIGGEFGLGAHLFQSLGQSIPVVGVAKSRYRNDTWSTPVTRGSSNRPLFVTAVGMDRSVAAHAVCSMSGKHRVPTVLRLVDQCARGALTNLG
jgi:deoxyribonuclease V